MKVDYLVWLKSGSCVEGRAESEAVDSLISTWQSRSTKQRAFACAPVGSSTPYSCKKK